MTINPKLLSIFSLSLLLAFTACNKDDENDSKLSKSDALNKISSFNASAKTDLQALSDADGLTVVTDFFNLVDQDDPFGRIGTDKKSIKRFFREKGHDFRNVFAPSSISGRTNGETAFDFESKKGVYEWNAETQVFDLTGDADIISIKFPTEGSQTNNAELQITAYEEQLVSDPDFGDSWEPTVLKARVLLNNVEKASLDLSLAYDDLGFPVAADISLSVTPYTASLSFDNTAATTSTISASLLKGTETLIATSVTVKYKDATKSEESLSTLEGFVQLKNLKLQGTLDYSGTNSGESLNDYLKLAVFLDGKKVGDVVFETIDGEDVPFLKYNDGSKEKLEDVFQPVVDELQSLGEDLG